VTPEQANEIELESAWLAFLEEDEDQFPVTFGTYETPGMGNA
jgi:hypothetical protein